MAERPAAEAGVASQTDHLFTPRGQWWQLCVICDLGAAAHAASGVVLESTPRPPYRCPDCVKLDRERCAHDIIQAGGGFRAR